MSRDEKYTGLSIKAAFQRSGDSMFLSMILENNGSSTFEVIFPLIQGFALKLNANSYKLQQDQIEIKEIGKLSPNESREVKIGLNNNNNETEIDGWPYTIDCAMKANDDVFIFRIPCSMSVAMVTNNFSIEEYK